MNIVRRKSHLDDENTLNYGEKYVDFFLTLPV